MAVLETSGILDQIQDAVTLNFSDHVGGAPSGVAIDLSGTFVGTITFEALVKNTWRSILGSPISASSAAVATATAAGAWQFSGNGLRAIRARCSAYTSGAVIVEMRASGQGGGGGSAGSGAITAAEGAIVALGNTTDDKSTATDTTSVSIVSLLKELSYTNQALKTALETNGFLSSTAVELTTTKGLAVAGFVAHDGVAAANPVPLGGVARSSEPAAVSTNADIAQLITDMVGKLIVLPYANPENFVSGAITSAMTGTTPTSLVGAPASGLRNYITTIVCSNAHATVGTDIVIQDGNGGTTLMTIPAAAVYGGAIITLPTPLRQPTTATAIYCANVTTGASTKVSAVGYKGA